MQDETKVERERHVLTLAPGDQLTGLSVFQIDQPHQHILVQVAEVTARQGKAHAGIQGCAIFRALGKGDVAVLTQWLSQGACTQAEPTLLKPPEQDLYQVVWNDHISGQRTSRIALEDGLFHFINVFRLTPRKRHEFIQYFQHLSRIVRVQPGYISSNLLISLDGFHAVNVGQFQTQHDFQAMLRKPRVAMGFAQGVLRRIVPGPPRLRQYALVMVSLSDTAHMEQTG
ncbi:antibiotic biosynthesis monooxygenase family protein [Ktedonosporobacter rubrisoli]|nr:antibiotic biosynthesis monooxygenase [Ktedonosporobacter rubrisoli]